MSSVKLKHERVVCVMIGRGGFDQALVFKADSEHLEVGDGAGVCSALRHVSDSDCLRKVIDK